MFLYCSDRGSGCGGDADDDDGDANLRKKWFNYVQKTYAF